jgi:hypothetical protein
LAKVMGLPLTETFMEAYHESIATCFIESSKCEVRLPAEVKLPPLAPVAPANGQAEAAETRAQEAETEAREAAQAEPISNISPNNANGEPDAAPGVDAGEGAAEAPEPPLPTVIPAGLPCRGSLIVDLKPAQLSLLLGKLAHVAEAKGGAWAALLTALQTERQTRLAKGRKRPGLGPAEDDGHGG